MADGYISAVRLPGNNTYDIKDKNAITEILIVGETLTKTNGVVNLPARVTLSNSSSTSFRPILTGHESWNSMGSYTTGAVTDGVYKSAKAFLKTSNGTFYGGYFVAANPVSGGSGNTAKRATLNSDGIYANNYLNGYSIAPYERQIIQAYAGKCSDSAGLLLRIDSGGLTIIGGGESGQNLAGLIDDDLTAESPARLDIDNSLGETTKETTALLGNSEHLILASDGSIYFVTKCNSTNAPNRVGVCLNDERVFYPMRDNSGSIGSSNYKWLYGYFGLVYSGHIYIKSDNLDRDGEAPTSDLTGKSLYFLDKDNNGVGRIYTVLRKTNNKKDLFITVYNASGTSNSIGIRILDDGTPSYYLSYPSAFRTTLDNAAYIGTNTITNNQVIVADGTDGKLKSSGNTIATSITNTDDTLPTSKAVKTFVEGKGYVTTDEKVKLIDSTTNASYRILFSNSANDDTETNQIKKSSKFLFNPSTGTLTLTGILGIKSTNIDRNTTSTISETITGDSYFKLLDKDGSALCYLLPYLNTDGGTTILLSSYTRNTADTSTVTNYILLTSNRDGTIDYKVASPTAFRAAIEAAKDDHKHGNILNDGTLQTNDITIASGDKLIVTDSSNSSKVARASISFDGSTTTKCLTLKGTWESFTDTDEKVKNEVGTSNTFYPAGRTSNSTSTGTQVFDTAMKFAGTTNGKAQLVLGNSTADGTAGGRFGLISIYSKSTSYGNLLQENVSSSVTHTFPATGGTILNTGNYDKYALPLTGGTMTGAINFKSSNLDRNNPPSSETTSDVYCNFLDKDGNYIGRVVSAMKENGDIELILRARARNAADTGYILNDFKIIKSRNGTNSYSVSSPTNFRTAIEALGFNDTKALLQATVGHSCKNLLKITATSTTKNGVAFNVNSTTGIITATGKSSANFYYTVGSIVNTDSTAMKLYMSGCANDGSTDTYYVYAYDISASPSARPKQWDNSTQSESCTFLTDDEEILIPAGHTVLIRIYIKTNYPGQNTTITFKPMVRDGNILNNTFEPYQTPTDEAKQDKLLEDILSPSPSNIIISGISNISYFIVNITDNGVTDDGNGNLIFGGPEHIYSVFVSISLLDLNTSKYFSYLNNKYISVSYTNNDSLYISTDDNNYEIKSIVYFNK